MDPGRREFEFAEVVVDRLLLEGFPNEKSPYFQIGDETVTRDKLLHFLGKLKYHINHSLSERQRQVLKAILKGKREREIASDLGVTQQVVHIYKHRAIKKLRKVLRA